MGRTEHDYKSGHMRIYSVHTCLDDVAGLPEGLQVHLCSTCTACTATAAAGRRSGRGHQVSGELEQRALSSAARAFAAARAASASGGCHCSTACDAREAACRGCRVEQYIGQEVFLQVWMHIGGGGIKGKTCPKGWALMGRESKEVLGKTWGDLMRTEGGHNGRMGGGS